MPTHPGLPTHRVLLVVAGTANQLEPRAEILSELEGAGHTVRLAYLDGEAGAGVRAIRQQHRLRATDTGAGTTGARQRLARGAHRQVLRSAERFAGSRRRLLLGAKFDPWFQRAVRSSDLVLLLDDAAVIREVVGELSSRPRTFTGPDALAVLTEQHRWDRLAAELSRSLTGASHGAPATDGVLAALRSLDADEVRLAPLPHQAPLLTLAELLMRRGRYRSLLDVVAAVERLGTVDLPAAGLAAVRAYAELAALGKQPGDLGGVVATTLHAADAALAREDLGHAADLASVALALLFHRDLHTDVPRTPLADEPTAFLAPLQGCEVIRLLTSAVPPRAASEMPVPADDRPGAPGTTSVVLLPGAYGRFATPVVQTLQSDPRVELSVLDLPGRYNTYRFMVVDPEQVLARLRQATRQPVPADEDHLRQLAGADVVYADWGDKGAVWASMFVPEGTRLVVRIHGVDALAPWVHLVDWSRVDDLVVVSRHMGDLVQEMLGERLDRTRVHVVPHVVDVARFCEPTLDGADHVLCMVGWGKKVKDPLWSVEVLAELLRRDGPDSDWRLLLVGADFPRVPLRTTNEYASAFRARVGRDDVRRHIDYVGETDHVPRHLRRAGFILSSSVRESFHIAVLEGVAAGAVPVVRDWPVFAGRDGARRLYPPDWVVRTPAEAAERIRALAAPAQRARAAAQARQELTARFSAEQFARQMLQIVLAPDPSRGRAAPVARR